MDILSYVMGMQAGKASGGSSGGGSLEAGGYWEQILPVFPGSYYGRPFVFKDELYLWQKTVSSGSSGKIYKFVDGQYTEILTVSIYAEPSRNVLVVGDLVHLIGGVYHYVFDGETVTQLNNNPKEFNVFLYKGELYGSYSTLTYIQKWVPDTDEWIETDIPYKGNSFEFNGELYSLYIRKTLYQWKNGEHVELCSAPVSLDSGALHFEKDGYLYFMPYSVPGTCYKYDSVNNAFVESFTVPHFSNYYYFYEYNGEIRVSGGTNNVRNHMRLHIIE